MKVIRKLPGEPAEPIELENALEALQAQVGGYIETVTPCTDFCIICNEEGRLMGLEPNCTIFGVDFVGPLLFVGIDKDEFCDVPEDAMSLAKMIGG